MGTNKKVSSAYKRRVKQSRQFWSKLRVYGFYIILLVFMVTGLLLWLRPKESTLEKRKLAEFPSVTVEGLWKGDFFKGVTTWYTDTYPMRETMLGQGSSMKNLYGLHQNEIHGDITQTADEIPDAGGKKAGILDTGTTAAKSQESTTEQVSPSTQSSATGTTEQSSGASGDTTTAEPVTPVTEQPTTEKLNDGTMHGELETAGTVYIMDGRAFSIYYFSTANADYYASMVNTLRTKLPSSVNLYDILAPTAWGALLGEEIQKELGGSSQEKAIDYVYSIMDDSVIRVPAHTNIINHNAEYIYYRSDHHWTVMGAYYAYTAWCQSKGIEPHSLDYFKESYEFTGFLGTFFSASDQSPVLESNPDTVLAFVPNGTNSEVFTDRDGVETNWHVIQDVTEWARTSKYNCFIGGDNPFTVIENPTITDGSACVLIKESYGNAFAPFLVDHYQYVYVVDYRYYEGNLTQFVKDKNVKDVILLNNMEALSQSRADTILSLFP